MQAQARVDRAKDPIEKVKAITGLERAQQVDGDAFRADFVAHAATWVEAEGVSAGSLRTFGVPAEVLVEAGLLDESAVASAKKRTRQPEPPRRRRAPSLSIDEVEAKTPHGAFSLADLAAAIGRESATARNYLARLVDAGVVVEIGPDPDHSGKGKAPLLYQRA